MVLLEAFGLASKELPGKRKHALYGVETETKSLRKGSAREFYD